MEKHGRTSPIFCQGSRMNYKIVTNVIKILRLPLRCRSGVLRMTAKLTDQAFRMHSQSIESTNYRSHSEQARRRSAGRSEESEHNHNTIVTRA